LAGNGLRGHPSIVEDEGGFASVFAAQPLLAAFDGLGEVWLSETLSYKLYPGCAYIDTMIDCVLSLQRQHNLDAKKVKSIHVAASPLTIGMQAMAAPFLNGAESLPVTLNFTVGYNVAVALLDKELTARQFTRERIKDPAVWALAERVTLSLDEEMGQRMRNASPVKVAHDSGGQRFELSLRSAEFANFKMSFGARVRIETEDGRHFEAEQEIPFGAVGRTFDDRRKSVEDKFRRETRYSLRKEKMERAIDTILHIEGSNPAQLRELIRNCCSERA
jgi:2-methylcitrate dehydratase PrpD